MKIEGRNPKGTSKANLETSCEALQDLELMGVWKEEEDVLDRDYWRFRLNYMRYKGNLSCKLVLAHPHSNTPELKKMHLGK